MISNFALGLVDDSVALWHRGERGGWLRVGAVPLGHHDLEDAVKGMVKVAHALAPDGVNVKLVIPEDQILYCELEIAGGNREAQRAQIRAALAGRTPYPVEELDFDWTGPARRVQVAIVARETLVEAEEFALRVGADPINFVAAPGNGVFAQEPVFGLTRTARRKGLRPDQITADPVLVETGVATLPDPSATEPPKAAKPEPQDAKVDADAQASANLTKPADAPTAVPEPKAPANTATPAATAAPIAEPIDATPAKQPSFATERSDKQASSSKPTEVESEVAFKSRRREQREARKKEGGNKGISAPTRPDPASKQDAPKAAMQPVVGKAASDRPRTGITALTSNVGMSKGVLATAMKEKLGSGIRDAQGMGRTAMQTALGSIKSLSASGLRRLGPSADDNEAAAAERAPQAPPQRKGPLETLKTLNKTPSASEEATRMTVFGARGRSLDQGSDLPRRALLLTGAVLLVLVATGFWAFYFNATRPGADPVVASAPVAPAEPDAALAANDPEIEAALAANDTALQDLDDAGEIAEARGPELADPLTEGGPAAGQSLLEADEGRVASLRSGQLVPPQDSALPLAPEPPTPFDPDNLPPLRSEVSPPVDNAELASPDTPEAMPQPEIVEPEIVVTESRPSVVPPQRPARLLRAPPDDLAEIVVPEGSAPSEQAAAFGDEPVQDGEGATDPITEVLQRIGGLSLGEVIEPAAIAPIDPLALSRGDGDQTAPTQQADPSSEDNLQIGVQTGRPPSVPPVRPAGLDPAPTPPEGQDQGAATLPQEQETPPVSTAAASAETPPPGGIALSALVPTAATRPAARPSDLRNAAPEPEPVDPFADASQLAVGASMRPTTRPNQFAAVVQRALRAAAPPRESSTPAVAAAPAPQAAAPIQTASAAVAMPNIPSSANVAREATQGRALNMRQLNLIGVIGTQSSRRALVRLSNGRVVTVRVGESLDGGQVTAIGESEVRYQRRGRDVVLRIAS